MKNRITVIEIIIIAVILSVFALFISPRFTYTKQQRQEATVRLNTAMAVSSTTSMFAAQTKGTMTQIAQVVTDTLNKNTKNPINKKNKAYVVNKIQEGSVEFVVDNTKNYIILKGYAQDTKTPLITKKIQK